MCAIAGVLGLNMKETVKKAMLDTMARRGPDGNGSYQREDVCLLHARLAIIDPEQGQQPMLLKWAGQIYVLVYNGELYNTRELRTQLEKLGHEFLGHSDTEVVLHSYAQWGEDCVRKFNGIFAFAVWEQERERLFLARDRIGVKPLFFTQYRNGLLFASEIKTILAYPGIPRVLDREGIYQLIMLGPGRMPGSGVFRGIRELEPGYRGYYENGHLKLERYWHLQDRENHDSFAEAVEKVRYLVTDAIRRQMVSDVPLGAFLSGGLDSSIISAVCAGEYARGGRQLNTFSVDYADNGKFFRASKFQPDSDDHYIDCMVDAIQSRHHRTVLTPELLMDALEEATLARDLPGMADVDFSLLAFCGDIRREVKVALSGECADEIFGGYPWYRDPEVRARAGFPWAQNTAQRAALLLTGGKAGESYVMEAYLDTCNQSDILPGTSESEKRMKQMVNLNFRWFMQTLLDRKDRMSMYHSLEVRVPFCDWRIAEYLYTIPWEYKDYQGQEKGLLRQAMAGILPEKVLYRRKSPYPKTFDPRYEELVRRKLEKLIKQDSPLFSLVRREQVERMMQEQPLWPWYGQLMGRPQTMAYFLQIDFWLTHYGVDIEN